MADFELEHTGDTAIIKLGTSLGMSNLTPVKVALKELVDGGASKVTIDLQRTTMLDSSGIGLLIAVGNSLQAVSGTLAISNVNPEIMRLLKSMRLVERLHASPSSQGGTHG